MGDTVFVRVADLPGFRCAREEARELAGGKLDHTWDAVGEIRVPRPWTTLKMGPWLIIDLARAFGYHHRQPPCLQLLDGGAASDGSRPGVSDGAERRASPANDNASGDG